MNKGPLRVLQPMAASLARFPSRLRLLLALVPSVAFGSDFSGFFWILWGAYLLLAITFVPVVWALTAGLSASRRSVVRACLLAFAFAVVPPVSTSERFVPLPLFLFQGLLTPDVLADPVLMGAAALSLGITAGACWFVLSNLAANAPKT